MKISDFVIVCIGSDKISGDSLGPLVGSCLREKYQVQCPVYGALGETVNGVNISEYAKMLEERHAGKYVISIDAAVGKVCDVGKIRLKKEGINAGGALEKKLGTLGNIGIVGVVAEETSPAKVYSTLLAVPYAFVEILAEKIASVIMCAIL